MTYQELKWERKNEYEWRAAAQPGYEIIWQVRDDGIAVLHGKIPATGGAVRMRTTDQGIARVQVALDLIDRELNAPLSKEDKARLVEESEKALQE